MLAAEHTLLPPSSSSSPAAACERRWWNGGSPAVAAELAYSWPTAAELAVPGDELSLGLREGRVRERPGVECSLQPPQLPHQPAWPAVAAGRRRRLCVVLLLLRRRRLLPVLLRLPWLLVLLVFPPLICTGLLMR